MKPKPSVLEKFGLVRPAVKRTLDEFISGGYRKKHAEGGQYNCLGSLNFAPNKGPRRLPGSGPQLSGLPQYLTAVIRANRAQ